MDSFWTSMSQWFKEKTSSPLYFTFVFSYIIFNWKFFYTLFWLESELYADRKISYVDKPFYQFTYTNLDFLISPAVMIVVPVVMTFILVKYLPLAHKWAYNIYVENHFDRKAKYYSENLKHEKIVATQLEQTVVVKKKQESSQKELQKLITEEEKWDAEFDEFVETGKINFFQKILSEIYGNRGKIYNLEGTQEGRTAISSSEAFGLINFIGNDRVTAELTEKGKYFSKKTPL